MGRASRGSLSQPALKHSWNPWKSLGVLFYGRKERELQEKERETRNKGIREGRREGDMLAKEGGEGRTGDTEGRKEEKRGRESRKQGETARDDRDNG